MKLQEYLKHLQKLVRENPEARKMDVIFAGDDEGNYYGRVVYGAGMMYFDEDENQAHGPTDENPANCVCLN